MSGDEQFPDGIDLDALGLGPMASKARTATFAPNWKAVLAADAFIGVIMVAAGVFASRWQWLVGALLIGAGVVYVLLVMRRFLQWRWLRRQVGLD